MFSRFCFAQRDGISSVNLVEVRPRQRQASLELAPADGRLQMLVGKPGLDKELLSLRATEAQCFQSVEVLLGDVSPRFHPLQKWQEWIRMRGCLLKTC